MAATWFFPGWLAIRTRDIPISPGGCNPGRGKGVADQRSERALPGRLVAGDVSLLLVGEVRNQERLLEQQLIIAVILTIHGRMILRSLMIISIARH